MPVKQNRRTSSVYYAEVVAVVGVAFLHADTFAVSWSGLGIFSILSRRV